MTTYRTGNPLGSAAPKDLYDNAENLDVAVNSQDSTTWEDRLGKTRKTFHGMEQSFQNFLLSSGYQDLGEYASGLQITTRNQIFRKDGEMYRAGADLDLPYTTTGDWATEGDSFVVVGDAALRQELAGPGGVAMVGRGVVAIGSIAALLALPPGMRKSDLRYLVKEYQAGSGVGGGEFCYDPLSEEEADGGLVFSVPGVAGRFLRIVKSSVSPEDFGAHGDGVEDDAEFFSACLKGAFNKGLKVTANGRARYLIKSQVTYFSGLTFEGNGAQVICDTPGPTFTNALWNAGRTVSVPAHYDDLYYRGISSQLAENPRPRITVSALAGSSTITLASTNGIAAGDMLLLSNGYCDMWRVMEQYPGESLDWVRPEVDLWRCEMVRVKSITGNAVTLDSPLSWNYNAVPKTYGFFSDENSEPRHAGWNFPTAERLGGVANVRFEDIHFEGKQAGTIAIHALLSIGVTTERCTFKGLGKGAEYLSCFSGLIKKCFSATSYYGLSIRRGSVASHIESSAALHVFGSDAPILIWEGSNGCSASNIYAEGSTENNSDETAAFYFNTAWNCSAVNISGKNLKNVLSVGFCRGGVVAENLVGNSCNLALSVLSSFGVQAGKLAIRNLRNEPSPYLSGGALTTESHGVQIKGLKVILDKQASVGASARIHLYKGFDINLDGIDAPQLWVHSSIRDDQSYRAASKRFSLLNSTIGHLTVGDTPVNPAENQRNYELTDTTILGQVSVVSAPQGTFKGVRFLGQGGIEVESAASSLELVWSPYTKLIDCEIVNKSGIGIDFKGATGSVGTSYQSSQCYMRGTTVSAPTKFSSLQSVAEMALGSMSELGRSGEIVSDLTQYPQIRTYANAGGDSNTSGWVLVEKSPGLA